MKTAKQSYKYIFGPVNSRRLGRSLGIDLIPYKTCSFDCVYCECGKTTKHTLERKEFFPLDEIKDELKQYLSLAPELDYITFSGSGEPLLYLKFGELAGFLKTEFPQYKTALLTNSSLFINEKARAECLKCDITLPSLDAGDDETFNKINRPCCGIKVSDIIEGLINFRNEFSGKIYLEIFIIPGINDSEEKLLKIKEAVFRIRPDEIQLNSLDRPGTEDDIVSADYEKLKEILEYMDYPGRIISRAKAPEKITPKNYYNIKRIILDTTLRRPLTMEDLMSITGEKEDNLIESVRLLEEKGFVFKKEANGKIFYVRKV